MLSWARGVGVAGRYGTAAVSITAPGARVCHRTATFATTAVFEEANLGREERATTHHEKLNESCLTHEHMP